MKIKKLIESAIVEDADIEDNDAKSLSELNPQTASISDIADAVQKDVADQTDGEKEVTDAVARADAQEIKDAAREVNADQAATTEPTSDGEFLYVTENQLTRVLDKALANSKRFMRRGDKFGSNVLVCGLPGSGKTAIVEDWAKQAGVYLYPVNAKNQKLETAMDGIPMRIEGTNEIAFLPVNLLKPLMEHENVVMFLDEYNRQTNPQIRGSLLTLINEKRTADKSMDFSKHLLFTVACINPGGRKADPGAAQLNDAERSRFVWNLAHFDSDPETSMNYFLTKGAERLAKLGVKVPEIDGLKLYQKEKDPTKGMTDEEKLNYYKNKDVEEEIMVLALAEYILNNGNHPFAVFEFDTDDQDTIDEINDKQLNLLNSRLLTDGLRQAAGNPKDFLEWVDSYSNMRDEKKQMFHSILDTLPDDWADATRAQFGLSKLNNPEQNEEQSTEQDAGNIDTAEEDDIELFTNPDLQPNTQNTNNIADPVAVVDDIKDIVSSWKK